MGLKVITKEDEERLTIETAKEIVSDCQEWIEFHDTQGEQVKLDGWFTLYELEAICALKRKALGELSHGLTEMVAAELR